MMDDSEKSKKELIDILQGKRDEEKVPGKIVLPSRKRIPPQVKGFPRKLTGTRVMPAMRSKKHPRNAPCPCGSGRKYKRCCGAPPALRPKVQAVRAMPSTIMMPKGNQAMAPDGMPMVATPRDLDPVGAQDIITAQDIEEKFDEMVKRNVEESKDEPESKIIVVSR